MKGLILKDLLGLKQVGMTLLLLMGFYALMAFMNRDASGAQTYFALMMLVVNLMIPMTCAGYDEQCGWDSFGAAMPVSRSRIVCARYLTCLLMTAGTGALVMLLDAGNCLIRHAAFHPTAYLYMAAVVWLYDSLILPIIYRFGVQKGRILMMAMALLPALVVVGFGYLADSGEDAALEQTVGGVEGVLERLSSLPVMLGILGVAAAALALSLLCSIRIYQKKDW